MPKRIDETERRYRVDLTEAEWRILEIISTKKKITDVKRLLNLELWKFKETHEDLILSDEQLVSRLKFYPIPETLIEFYEGLAKMFNMPVSTVISRFVIEPMFSKCSDFDVLKHLPQKNNHP